MTFYDPVWDMPLINWLPQGSFEVGAIPPSSEPDAEPLVCLPAINQDWLPYVLGCLDQLRNPSTWLVADDDAMSIALLRATRLKQMIGGRADCMPCTLVRLASCQLQTSCDDGATWTTATGWDPGFFECVQEALPVIGLPPNPGDLPHNGLACAIASYLADKVIKASIQAAVTNKTDALVLLDFGATILTLIPEFILVTVAYDAFSIVYTDITLASIADYESALSDASLWVKVTCAIYEAIVTEGFVTPVNFPDILANIGGISYAHADVIATIVAYVTAIGATGLAQLSQIAGLNTSANCDSCDAWCHLWGATGTDLCNGDWALVDGGEGSCTTEHWTGGFGPSPYDLSVGLTLPGAMTITRVDAAWDTSSYHHITGWDHDGGTMVFDSADTPFVGAASVGFIKIQLETVGLAPHLQNVHVSGLGVSPFGADNC
jgi:hypothetical protein